MDNPYAAPQSDSIADVDRSPEEETYAGIGGWLILVGIGVVINPLVLGSAVFFNSIPPFFNGTWESLTTPGNPGYHSMWGVVIVYELLMNVALEFWAVFVAFLFFGKRKALPRVIIGFFAARLVFAAVDYLLCSQIPLIRQQLGDEFSTDIMRQVIACGIWIPYFRVSKRVKGTFVR